MAMSRWATHLVSTTVGKICLLGSYATLVAGLRKEHVSAVVSCAHVCYWLRRVSDLCCAAVADWEICMDSCMQSTLCLAVSTVPVRVHEHLTILCWVSALLPQVNKCAQKTDAGQLSRNLLLVPRATVNVKPNLQIVADDVKCTHGCAVSDLSEEELFYFRARGINSDAARQALVFSFGAEVVRELMYEGLTSRIQADVVETLKTADVPALHLE